MQLECPKCGSRDARVPVARVSVNGSREWLAFILYAAAAVKPAGRPVRGNLPLGNTPVVPSVIVRNSPPGANIITLRLAGPSFSYVWVRRRIAVPRAAATSPALRGARKNSLGGIRNAPNARTVESDSPVKN